ncbi:MULTISPECIES: hypothetical protein [Pseudomonas]|jgi:hypothetical protein|uniref:CcoQ/FixQ family Cbb3-type cytochrome c oxidase assembly chaperone n=1 Tax=Pseudomonas weihenstephanensis TaxID=1608994 RepID=A0A0J6LFY0_9PSED|nr:MULTISPECIES: hypothetical protein [Pseudomonas]GLX91024.1 hypothetical protein Pfra02_35920 [Pseudomonas fragi]KMN13286.1 hypothetical protein TU86_14575 [Pseudomonas weihenstephanensis]KMN17793.1 hypothetical protein TU87_14665 [Pseudomonas weihenstephanensis]KVV04297.1 hypothetical protein AP060_02453 [Pseudomonas sp. TAD18]KVV05869.1 hypothetical protein AP059_02564 [Pseudomonas sp. TAA207]
MIDIALNMAAVTSLYFAISWCLKHQTERDIDEASLIPFADDPQVARRVEEATGKTINAVQMSEEPVRTSGQGTLKF